MSSTSFYVYIYYFINFYACRYGRPGVEFYGQHEAETNVSKMIFLPGQGRLVTLTEDNHLHLWEINGTTLKVNGCFLMVQKTTFYDSFSKIGYTLIEVCIFMYLCSRCQNILMRLCMKTRVIHDQYQVPGISLE